MKLHVQRLVVLLAVLVLCVTSLVLPCQAAEAPRRGFQDWASNRGGGFGYEDDEYTKFIDDLNTAYGSVIFDSKGGYWIGGRIVDASETWSNYVDIENITVRGGGFSGVVTDFVSGTIKRSSGAWSMDTSQLAFVFRHNITMLPAGILFAGPSDVLFSSSFPEGLDVSISSVSFVNHGVMINDKLQILSSTGIYTPSGSTIPNSIIRLNFNLTNKTAFSFGCQFDLRHLAYFIPETAPTDVINNTESRPGSLFGDIIYVGDDGSQMVADEIFIVNEGDNTVYNPVTGDTWNIETWTYDYSTRTYEITTTTGNTVNVTYGDENITINEGGNTINIYYGGSGGGNNPDVPVDPDNPDTPVDPDQPDDGNWFTKFLEAIGSFLGGAVGALVELIASFFTSLLESLGTVVSGVVTSLTNLVSLFGSFGEALRALWTWLPNEIVTIMVAAVSVVTFGALIRLFIK